jgi:hypothetical protein
LASVADPDLSDPYVFGPPGSGSESLVEGIDPDPAPDPSISQQKYSEPSKSQKQKKLFEKKSFFVAV